MKFGKKIREIRVANKISKYKVRRDIKLQYSQIDAIENDEIKKHTIYMLE